MDHLDDERFFAFRMLDTRAGPRRNFNGGENLEAWTEKYDTPIADQKTLELQGVCSAKITQDFKSCLQNVNEVANIVKKILLSEKPNLRYQTNDNFNPDAVKARLADPTGNDLVEMLNKKYLAKE